MPYQRVFSYFRPQGMHCRMQDSQADKSNQNCCVQGFVSGKQCVRCLVKAENCDKTLWEQCKPNRGWKIEEAMGQKTASDFADNEGCEIETNKNRVIEAAWRRAC